MNPTSDANRRASTAANAVPTSTSSPNGVARIATTGVRRRGGRSWPNDARPCFLQRLIRDARRKVFLILDRLPVHRAAMVRDWLARHKAQIEVFYLPSYSPEP